MFTILANARETGGRFGLVESLSPKGTEPPRHVHSQEDEVFYLLEGEITFYVGEETHEATPEEFFRPPQSSEPARALEVPPPSEGPPDVPALVAALEDYGVEVVGPPGPPLPG
jgi:hypothetical protein